MASKILNTARTLYAENEAESMGSAVKQAVHAHISSAIHPTNVIGKAFGYGSFAHTIARRYISGEPEFEPGGIKNPFKSDLKRKKGEKADDKKTDPKTSAKIAIQAEQAVKSGRTDVVMLRTLSQVDVNTRQTNSYLQDIVEGNAKLAGTAEETATEAKNADDQQTAALVKAMMGLGKSGDGAALSQASNGFLGNIGTGLEMGVGSAAGSAVAGALGGVVSKLGVWGLAAAMIGNGMYQGIEEWNKTGDLGKALYAALNGLTFGLAGAMADGLKQGVTDLRKDVKEGKALTSDPTLNAKMGGWGATQAAQQQRASTQLMDDSAGRAWDKKHRWGMGLISSDPFDASVRPPAKPLKVYGRRKTPMTVAPAAPKYTEGGMTGLHGVSPAVPPEGARLLDAIAGSESPGYNVINGGARFTDMSDHPFASTNKATGYGLAAGRYQFMPATWNEYKAKLGLTDFSPGSQDIAAWALAQDRYAANTRGRNLQADLNDPSKAMLIGQALHSTWTSLPGGAERNSKTDSFAARLAGGGGGGGASASADYATITKAQASATVAPGLDVVAMTAATQAMARQQATVSGDTQFEMANAPVDGPSSAGPNFSVMGASGGNGDVTASSGLSGSSTEGIDDIISKVLVAMGAVTQT